jgi:predicted TIM-barrel fold metal-dependent hydrolase
MNKFDEVKRNIAERLNDMKWVDNHEHLTSPFLQEATSEMDLPYFLTHTYLFADLISSGMPEVYLTPEKYKYLEKPFGEDQSEQRWKELKPYIEKVRNTIYYRYLLIALRDLYGLKGDEIDDSNWKEISERIREKSKNHLDWSLSILDKMKVHKVILDISGTNLPNNKIIKDERLVQVVRMDEFIYAGPTYMSIIKNFTDEKVHSFDDYTNVVDLAFKAAKKAGVVAIKSTMAYIRSLDFNNVGRADAEKVFNRDLEKISQEEKKVFQDYMMHFVCQKCAEYKFPLQIHTGIQAGNYNTITNARPTLLTNLFQKYPDVRFDLFHAGYPYIQEAGVLTKYFPNVYLDACWLAHISPAAYKKGLDEWLEVVPSNKIFAWGGDHGILDHSYASLKMTKELISEVLAMKVATGYFSEKVALSVAEGIVGGNAIEFYGF